MWKVGQRSMVNVRPERSEAAGCLERPGHAQPERSPVRSVIGVQILHMLLPSVARGWSRGLLLYLKVPVSLS